MAPLVNSFVLSAKVGYRPNVDLDVITLVIDRW